MSKFVHILLITIYVAVIVCSIAFPAYYGLSFYSQPILERPFDANYELLKPSGVIGHGYGIAGTLLILSGITIYTLRKRWKFLANLGRLKYWLEFHIFLCTWGTILVIYHTTFKFGGIISVGFWSLILVWLSGLVGRFIYLQIPRTLEGREYSQQELDNERESINIELQNKYGINISQLGGGRVSSLRIRLLSQRISKKEAWAVRKLILKERILNRKMKDLTKMHKLFNAWHYIHLPFSSIMLVIMIIHVCVTLFFGYKWIF